MRAVFCFVLSLSLAGAASAEVQVAQGLTLDARSAALSQNLINTEGWLLFDYGDRQVDLIRPAGRNGQIARFWERFEFFDVQRDEEGTLYESQVALIEADCVDLDFDIVQATNYPRTDMGGEGKVQRFPRTAKNDWSYAGPATIMEEAIKISCAAPSAREKP